MLLKSRSYSSLITKSWSSNLESPPTRGRAETASMERKREDQSSLLPMKNFQKNFDKKLIFIYDPQIQFI